MLPLSKVIFTEPTAAARYILNAGAPAHTQSEHSRLGPLHCTEVCPEGPVIPSPYEPAAYELVPKKPCVQSDMPCRDPSCTGRETDQPAWQLGSSCDCTKPPLDWEKSDQNQEVCVEGYNQGN